MHAGEGLGRSDKTEDGLCHMQVVKYVMTSKVTESNLTLTCVIIAAEAQDKQYLSNR